MLEDFLILRMKHLFSKVLYPVGYFIAKPAAIQPPECLVKKMRFLRKL
jgi:hypothetical protein